MDYLGAVDKVGSPGDGRAVVAQMKQSPVDDPLFGHVVIRQDGRAVHPMYLLQVKAPDESKDKWDVFKVTATIPAAQAFRPLDQGGCPLVPKQN
jgi:branched-chain amino acid transport system substrate-binding protein